MATVSTFANNDLARINQAAQHLQKVLALVNGSALNGDDITVLTFPPQFKGRIVGAALRQSGSLGAGATLQLRVGTTAITGATTAATASKVTSDSDIDVPLNVNGGDRVNLLVGGANITAGANATVDLLIAARE